MSVASKVKQLNRWRDTFNPLRSLPFPRAVSLLEQYQRGEYADIEWTYSFIERRDADLIALIERRISALREMDWDIKTVDNNPTQKAMAEKQAQTLRAAYERIDNLGELIEHLAMGTFRGFSLAQFQNGDKAAKPGVATHAECLDHWNIARNGSRGDWYWNPEARVLNASTLGDSSKIDTQYCIVRSWPRPINEIALIKFVRQNLSQKDWDAFIEIYGIPGWLVIMPAGIPPEKVAEYRASAEEVAEGGSGALPNGSDAKCADQPRGVNPFRDHLQYLTEKLVLAGTGGLLTMLTAAGSGTLAGSAHMEAFQTIARGESKLISELFQRNFDKSVLEQSHPGEPCLAYFELAANEETDVGAILEHAVKISQAGGEVDWAQFSEKTGYQIVKSLTPPPVAPAPGVFRNRSATESPKAESARMTLVTDAVDVAMGERAKLLTPWLQSLASLESQSDLTDEQFLAEAEALIAQLNGLLTAEEIATLAAPLEAALGTTVVNALATQKGVQA